MEFLLKVAFKHRNEGPYLKISILVREAGEFAFFFFFGSLTPNLSDSMGNIGKLFVAENFLTYIKQF